MKAIALTFIITLCSCQSGMEKNNISNDSSNALEDTLTKPAHVAADAKLINLGFVDAPVYVWIEFIGHYNDGKHTYDHIYGIKHTYEGQNYVDTSYYETASSRQHHVCEDGIKNANLLPYPGDGTYRLTCRNDTFFFHFVMQTDTQVIDGKTWQMGLPIAKYNKNGEKVYNDAVDVRIDSLTKDVFLVSLIGDYRKEP
jgi:hypothetical protein